jgi:hypothetical protein
MADVFDFELRIMRDGETWYVINPGTEYRHLVGSYDRLAAAITPLMYGLVLVKIECDGERTPLDEWCSGKAHERSNRKARPPRTSAPARPQPRKRKCGKDRNDE